MIQEAFPSPRRFEVPGVRPEQITAVYRGDPRPASVTRPWPVLCYAPGHVNQEYSLLPTETGTVIEFRIDQYSHQGPLHKIYVEYM